jgi:hypothetical protein
MEMGGVGVVAGARVARKLSVPQMSEAPLRALQLLPMAQHCGVRSALEMKQYSVLEQHELGCAMSWPERG